MNHGGSLGLVAGGQGPRFFLYGFDLGNVLAGGGPQLLELSSRGQDTAFKRTGGVIISIHGLAERRTDALKVLGEFPYAVVEILSEVADLLCILRELHLSPTVGHRPQQHNERGAASPSRESSAD